MASLAVLLAVAFSCQNGSTAAPETPQSGAVTAPYTPVVILTPGTLLPPASVKVTVQDLVAQPEQYAGEFILVEGLNGGFYKTPECYPWIGPPTEWLLLSRPTEGQDGPRALPRIEVKNAFGGIISSPSGPDGRAVRNTMMKGVAVWGWLRLYEGPVGCQHMNAQGTPIPMETKRVWYVDAAQLQFLESIETARELPPTSWSPLPMPTPTSAALYSPLLTSIPTAALTPIPFPMAAPVSTAVKSPR
jgi:hypothetical protein